MPIRRPEHPTFASSAERGVWTRLVEQLFDDEAVLAGVRVTDRTKDHEADLIVLSPGLGVIVLEVKGGSVWLEDGQWRQSRRGSDVSIDPVRQARQARYALRTYVEGDARWPSSHRRVRWAHAVVLPHTEIGDDFAMPDCPRWMVIDRTEMDSIGNRARAILRDQDNDLRALTTADVDLIQDILAGRGRAQRDLLAEAQDRDEGVRRLTEDQALILGAVQLLNRVEVRGGAGSGKTWLALEQARRIAASGGRVALLCYSRGLAEFLRREVAALPVAERPAYVGEFHGLGHSWGAAPGSDDDSDYWEHRLPAEMVDLARHRPTGELFDAIVIDEAQDFADDWWSAVLAMLRDEEAGGLSVFSDEGQRVFARFGQPPVPLVPLMLDRNLRNTRQIAETFNPLAPMRMRLFGGEGPAVRFVACPAADAMEAGDDAVEALLDDGWSPGDIALLTTGSRHPEQVMRQAVGQADYWASFWDPELPFYGHVLGFKGLERRAVVLVLNEANIVERSRERLYVGLSRARDQLVVCGDPEVVRALGGESVLAALRGEADPTGRATLAR